MFGGTDGFQDPFSCKMAPVPSSRPTGHVANLVVVDLNVHTSSSIGDWDPRVWHRIDKDLYLYASEERAWLCVAVADEKDLAAKDLVVTDIVVGKQQPFTQDLGRLWESRPCGIWILRGKFSGKIDRAVTSVDVLFGKDAAEPRPQRALVQSPLHIDLRPGVPVARLSILHGRVKPTPDVRPLRVGEDSKFKVVVISDTHMVTGPGTCRDAIDACGNTLPESEADPRTVRFIEEILDDENPSLFVLNGDITHHDVPNSMSAAFKAVAPAIQRSICWTFVFGNHDDEGTHALTRMAQMSVLRALPFCLSEPGPEGIGGIGNYFLEVLAPTPSDRPLLTLYFLDSHGGVPSDTDKPDYKPIQQRQIDWFTSVSQARRSAREHDELGHRANLSMAFFHIPIPEFGDSRLHVRSGRRGEPTEGSSINSHLHDAMVKEGVTAVTVGHDHVNTFVGRKGKGPWLCHVGGGGFGGYGSYDGKSTHRSMRVFEFEARKGSLTTWLRCEYNPDRVDECQLVEHGRFV